MALGLDPPTACLLCSARVARLSCRIVAGCKTVREAQEAALCLHVMTLRAQLVHGCYHDIKLTLEPASEVLPIACSTVGVTAKLAPGKALQTRVHLPIREPLMRMRFHTPCCP